MLSGSHLHGFGIFGQTSFLEVSENYHFLLAPGRTPSKWYQLQIIGSLSPSSFQFFLGGTQEDSSRPKEKMLKIGTLDGLGDAMTKILTTNLDNQS